MGEISKQVRLISGTELNSTLILQVTNHLGRVAKALVLLVDPTPCPPTVLTVRGHCRNVGTDLRPTHIHVPAVQRLAALCLWRGKCVSTAAYCSHTVTQSWAVLKLNTSKGFLAVSLEDHTMTRLFRGIHSHPRGLLYAFTVVVVCFPAVAQLGKRICAPERR